MYLVIRLGTTRSYLFIQFFPYPNFNCTTEQIVQPTVSGGQTKISTIIVIIRIDGTLYTTATHATIIIIQSKKPFKYHIFYSARLPGSTVEDDFDVSNSEGASSAVELQVAISLVGQSHDTHTE